MTLIKIFYESSEEMFPLSSLEFSPDLLKTLDEMGIITLHAGIHQLQRVKTGSEALALKKPAWG